MYVYMYVSLGGFLINVCVYMSVCVDAYIFQTLNVYVKKTISIVVSVVMSTQTTTRNIKKKNYKKKFNVYVKKSITTVVLV